MAANWADVLKQAVESVKKKIKTEYGGQFFDSYHVLDELRSKSFEVDYIQYVARYGSFQTAHMQIGADLERNQDNFGIKKVFDSDNVPVRIPISETIRGGIDTVQLWKIIENK